VVMFFVVVITHMVVFIIVVIVHLLFPVCSCVLSVFSSNQQRPNK
jgi:hypothetical protein